MKELSVERIEEILHRETAKKEETAAILRAIYTRHMRLFERYFADIDALTDEKVHSLRDDYEETESLIRYYYMDIPQDICKCLQAFDSEYGEILLGADWHKVLFDLFREFKEKQRGKGKSKEAQKAEFQKQMLDAFYDAMDYIFRDGFGTGSQTFSSAANELQNLLFGKEK